MAANTNDKRSGGDTWDWSTVVLVVLAVTVVLALTIELWNTHPFGGR
ncbi:MAG: hypothetical protein ABL986_17395 [Vicinamibacterales bacterium]